MIYTLGVSLSSIAPLCSLEVIALLEQSKFHTFESVYRVFPRDKPELISAFREMLDRTGKKAPTYHCPYGGEYDISLLDESARHRAVRLLINLFPEAEALGASILVVHASPSVIPADERHFRIAQVKRSLWEFLSVLQHRKIRMAVELLPRGCIGNTVAELFTVLEELPDEFGVCLDVNHMMANIDGLPEAVRQLGTRLYHLHVSDYDGIDERHWLPGDGKIDWWPFLVALRQNNYQGAFNYELRLTGPPKERIKKIESNYKNFILPLMRELAK